MKFKELCQQSFAAKLYNPYSLISCWSNDTQYALIGSQKTAWLLTVQNTIDLTSGTLNFKWDVVIPTTYRPTSYYIQQINMKEIYKNAHILERQVLVLDPRYATDFAKAPKDPQIKCISWPQSNCTKFKNLKQILAVVSHYGACEIVTRDPIKNEFSGSRIVINDELRNIFDHHDLKNIKTVESLQNCIENFVITSCCWAELLDDNDVDNSYGILLCATESGWILGFNVVPWTATLQFKLKTDLKSIKYLKSFTCKSNGTKKNLLFVSNVTGLLKVYEIHKDGIEEVSTLWSKDDKLSIHYIDITYHENLDKLFVATTKSSHFLVFALSSDGKLCSKTHHYIGNAVITGLQRATPFEYILSTVYGYVEYIQVIYNEEQLEIQSDTIEHDLMTDNNQILGMITTPNKVGWLFVLYRNKSTLKNPGILTLCTLNVIEPLGVLLNTKNYYMDNYLDCTEVMRLKLLAEYDIEDYTKFKPELQQINEEFVHRLRIRKTIVNGILASNNKKQKRKQPSIDKELENIDDTICAFYLCDRLKYFIDLKNLTKFQCLCGKYIKKLLHDYLQKDNLLEQYANIRNILAPLIESFLLECGNIFDEMDSSENCIYCNELIQLDTMMCSNNHNMARCCVTLVQVQLFTKRYCPQCKRVAIDDENSLNEILNTEIFRCPFCAIPFVMCNDDFSD